MRVSRLFRSTPGREPVSRASTARAAWSSGSAEGDAGGAALYWVPGRLCAPPHRTRQAPRAGFQFHITKSPQKVMREAAKHHERTWRCSATCASCGLSKSRSRRRATRGSPRSLSCRRSRARWRPAVSSSARPRISST